MVPSTEIFSETLTYPGLERILHNVLFPAIAVNISQISYRPGYLPNPDNDRLLLSQIVTISNQPLIADSVEIWIKEGLQLVTFPIDSAYSLRLVFPAWYQEIAVTVSTIDGLALAPGSGSVTSQAGLNAAIAQFNAALALKAAAADVSADLATKADVSQLSDFINTSELVQALALKADEVHQHDDLYYPQAQTYNRDEVDAALNALADQLSQIPAGGGALSVVSSPDYAISSHPNGHPQWGGPMAGAFDPTGASGWNTTDGGTGCWIGQSFPAPVQVREVRFRTGYGEGVRDASRVIRQYRIESAANINGPWTGYGIRATQENPFSLYATVINEPQNHSYWRIFVVLGSTSFVTGLQDCQFLA